MDKLIPLGRLFFAIGLAGFGILQFIYGDFVAGRAPAWPDDVPGRLVWAYSSGVFLAAAGGRVATPEAAGHTGVFSAMRLFRSPGHD